MKSVDVSAAVIIDANGRIFAAERGYGNYKGWWEFPGGKIEPGETPEQALKREILEELDTMIEVGEIIGEVDYDYPEFHLHMRCFRCRVVKGNLTLKEHDSSAWLSCDGLYGVKWLPADFPILERIADSLKSIGGCIEAGRQTPE